MPNSDEANQLVIFSRKSNRLILNEEELLSSLATEFDLTPAFIRMEDQTFEEQVAILGRAKIAIGMHGSIMIMGMFMPPGSILVELYPFAVPSENYTPYRTMSNLLGMNLVYRVLSPSSILIV
jgi:protein O-mannose beta-1,4-N-acetylglucosaminyltransferase